MDQPTSGPSSNTSRRGFLGTTAAIGAGAIMSPLGTASPRWEKIESVPRKLIPTTSQPPVEFPSDIEFYRQAFRNWSGGIRIDDLWTCQPADAQEIVTLANWAAENGYTIRARGYSHNWSPIVVAQDTTLDTRVILLDMTANFTDMEMSQVSPPAVTVGAGASMVASVVDMVTEVNDASISLAAVCAWLSVGQTGHGLAAGHAAGGGHVPALICSGVSVGRDDSAAR